MDLSESSLLDIRSRIKLCQRTGLEIRHVTHSIQSAQLVYVRARHYTLKDVLPLNLINGYSTLPLSSIYLSCILVNKNLTVHDQPYIRCIPNRRNIFETSTTSEIMDIKLYVLVTCFFKLVLAGNYTSFCFLVAVILNLLTIVT